MSTLGLYFARVLSLREQQKSFLDARKALDTVGHVGLMYNIQGTILCPLSNSLFVDSLLDQLTFSGHGVSVGYIHCANSNVYADNFVRISVSKVDLHHMLAITSNYALLSHYHFNAAVCCASL